MDQPTTVQCKKVFEIFGDRWNLQIVNSIRLNSLRFNDIQRAIEINSATLTQRLKRLEELSLIFRTEHTCDKQSVSYELTDLGRQLVPLIDQMLTFTDKLE